MAITTQVQLSQRLLKVHAYMVENNLDTRDLINIVITNRNGLLTENEVTINYEDLSVTFSETYAQDFSVSVYVNRAVYETIAAAMEDDSIFFKDNIIAVFRININGEQKIVPVYKLRPTQDESRNPLTSLRIKTKYGIGYVGLLDVTDEPTEDEYRICIGNDLSGNPIIKKLDLVEVKTTN
jgi:hypothetical protein